MKSHSPPKLKTYYTATVTKPAGTSRREHLDQWNRIETQNQNHTKLSPTGF